MSLYTRGLSTRDIQDELKEMYDVDVSPSLISEVTDAVLAEVKAWQARPLEALYPVIYLDCIFVKLRVDGVVRTQAVYVAIAITLSGLKEVLGLWVGREAKEGATFWLAVLTELQQRGLEDVFIFKEPSAAGSIWSLFATTFGDNGMIPPAKGFFASMDSRAFQRQ